MNDELIIGPRTKIAELLMAYPQLEDVLISIAPQFKKLKNPVIRKTVAKVTSLAQAASVGGVKVEDLINQLRSEVGQSNTAIIDTYSEIYNTKKPEWFKEEKIVNALNLSDRLNAGEHPVHEVLSSIKALKAGEIFAARAPFVPAPLLAKTVGLNFEHWITSVDDEFLIYFKNDL